MKKKTRLITKVDFAKEMKKYIHFKINGSHLRTLLIIIIEEMLREILDGKKINVKNFCDFEIYETFKAVRHNVNTGLSQLNGGHKILKIFAKIELKNLLCKHLDKVVDDPYV
jgi:nucleoid DNA-binding protein